MSTRPKATAPAEHRATIVYDSFAGRYSDSPRALHTWLAPRVAADHVWMADPAHRGGFPSDVPPYARPAPDAPPPPAPPPPADLPPGQGPLLPSEATPPQASGPAVATYDSKTGVFADPAGGTGVYADGMDKVSTAETWVDLMLDPRQA